MQTIFKVILTIFFAFQIFPQSDTHFILYWGARDLTWDDFQGIPPENSIFLSEISYGIGYRTFEKPVGEMDIKWIEAYCYMDRGSSWVKKEDKNESTLIYNQTIFDIVELYTRRYQDEINNLSGSTSSIIQSVEELLREYNSQIKNRLDVFYSESNGGQNSEKVNFWYHDTKLKLEQLNKNIMRKYKLSRWGFGFTFDLGYGLLSGNATKYFSNNFNLAFDFDVSYRPIVLYLGGILGINSINREFMINDNLWTKDLSSGLAVVNISVGYPLDINDDFKLTPFAGVGVVEFSIHNKNDEYDDYKLDDFTGIFGVNLDYQFSRSLNLIDDFIFREKSNWVIRTRLTFAPFRMSDEIKGWTMNLTIGVGGFTNIVNL